MPRGTKIDKVYEGLLHAGKTPESAAKISQSATGMSLATGRPPKHATESAEPPSAGEKPNAARKKQLGAAITKRKGRYV